MGFFDFIANAGKKLLGGGDDSQAIKDEIISSFADVPIENLSVGVADSTVTLAGLAQDIPVREKAILIAGNVKDISQVEAEQLLVKEVDVADITQPVFYTIKKGDTLWKIAAEFYKNGAKYTKIVEANLEVIKNADLIYPGQVIRIP